MAGERKQPTMLTISGLPVARGLASGPAFVYRGEGDTVVPDYRIEPGAEKAEVERLNRARERTRHDLEALIATLRERTGRDDVKVFEAHLQILEDPMLVEGAEKFICEQRYNAATAVCRILGDVREQFARMNDPYLRERAHDLDDVERRLLKALLGTDSSAVEIKTPSIVVADNLTPSESVRMPRDMILGFATNGGSSTSHAAILARALGIPAVSGLGDITSRVESGATVLLDGINGTVTIDPDAETRDAFAHLESRQRANRDAVTVGPPAGTLADGDQVLLYANIQPGIPFAGLREFGVRGIGLYRSEYLWLGREREPTEEEQFETYRGVAQFAASLGPQATVTIRTLDIGGDKAVRGVTVREENPFLGNRSIRYLLSHPAVFRTQLRAILRASAFGPVCLMYPMVSCVEELEKAARLLDEVRRELDGKGIAYSRDIPVGAMIEVPAAAIAAEALARYVSFFSIGTNDLIQYAMAADRANDSVAHLYQPMHPSVMWLVRHTIGVAKRTGVHVGVCGESAADPVAGVLWAAMGAEMLSMAPRLLSVISSVLRRLSRADLDAYAAYVASLDVALTATEIHERACGWLRAKIPDFDRLLI